MSLNFTLNYNQGVDYMSLMPKTSIEAIISNKTSRQSIISVTIPPTNEVTQTIAIETNDSQLNATVYMIPTSINTLQQIFDYQTINQFQVSDNLLTITRLYDFPLQEIQVILVFIHNDSNIMRFSEIDVEIPVSNDFIQQIPIVTTYSQSISPVYMELISQDSESFNNYNTITQFYIFENNLTIYRTNKKPTASINVKLIFKEGGNL